MIRPVVRTATEADDFSALPVLSQWPWNRRQVLVAEHGGGIVGAVVLWDAGHGIVQAGPLEVVPAVQGQGVMVALCLGVIQYARDQGHRAITFYVSSPELLEAVMQYGGQRAGAYQGVIYAVR